MKIHKSTIISLAFLAAVYLVMQWRGKTASVEKNSQSASVEKNSQSPSETQVETGKSDREKD